ncbi:MAG: hypothetical protein GY906_34205 [bacterium]|nr:hypothetical protein [bacterium]
MSSIDCAPEPVSIAVGQSGQALCVSSSAIAAFAAHRQSGVSEPEAGGVLFARFDLPNVIIERAAAPSCTDRRSRFAFFVDKGRRRKQVKRAYKNGLHFIGEWHTHPQADPTPSPRDLLSMNDLFVKSCHELNFFVMIIVGNRMPELSLWISLHDASSVHLLKKLLWVPEIT